MRRGDRQPGGGRALWALAGLWLWASPGFAQSRELVTNGVDAALTNGTVVATAESGAAIWYNPASLVSVNAGALDFSGSVYSMRVAIAPSALSSDSGGRSDSRDVNFRIVPRALSVAFDLRERLILAVGLFYSGLTETSVQAQLGPGDGAGWALSNAVEASATHLSLAIAWEAREDLCFGWTFDAVYGTASLLTVLGEGDPDSPSDDLYNAAEQYDAYAGGPQIRAGVRYEPVPGYRIGASLSTPTVAIFANETGLKVHDGPGDGQEISPRDTGVTDVIGGTWDYFEPARVRLGLARMWEKGWVALDGDLRMPMQSELWYDRGWGGTLRLGGLRWIRPRVRIGGGLFASLERPIELTDVGQESQNYYGANFGVDVSNRELHVLTKGTISIALALSYVYGRGERLGLVAPLDADAPPMAVPSHLRTHELSLNLAFRASR